MDLHYILHIAHFNTEAWKTYFDCHHKMTNVMLLDFYFYFFFIIYKKPIFLFVKI